MKKEKKTYFDLLGMFCRLHKKMVILKSVMRVRTFHTMTDNIWWTHFKSKIYFLFNDDLLQWFFLATFYKYCENCTRQICIFNHDLHSLYWLIVLQTINEIHTILSNFMQDKGDHPQNTTGISNMIICSYPNLSISLTSQKKTLFCHIIIFLS